MPQLISGSPESPSSFRLCWQAEPGIRYGVECSANLQNWLPTGPTVLASNNIAEATCSTAGVPIRFFRVFETN